MKVKSIGKHTVATEQDAYTRLILSRGELQVRSDVGQLCCRNVLSVQVIETAEFVNQKQSYKTME